MLLVDRLDLDGMAPQAETAQQAAPAALEQRRTKRLMRILLSKTIPKCGVPQYGIGTTSQYQANDVVNIRIQLNELASICC